MKKITPSTFLFRRLSRKSMQLITGGGAYHHDILIGPRPKKPVPPVQPDTKDVIGCC